MTTRDQVRREHESLLPPGLVLGHRVLVYHAGAGRAFRGRVESLEAWVEVRLDRAKWSGAFRVGDRVRALHVGRHAVDCEVVGAESGRLRLNVLVD